MTEASAEGIPFELFLFPVNEDLVDNRAGGRNPQPLRQDYDQILS
jgi:hypothetical protein